jgi:hypothetical protein
MAFDSTETAAELKPEAGGGGNRIRPPTTVITGEYPEDENNRLRRELEELNKECARRETSRRMAVLKAWFRSEDRWR